MVKKLKAKTNDVFRGSNATSHVRVMSLEEEMTNKCPLNIFKGLEGSRNVRLRFLRGNENFKGQLDAFSGHKQRSNVCLVYLDVKLHQDSCG